MSEERRRAVDELGHRAGAALRRPPPPGGLAAITRNARQQRLVRGGVAVVAAAGLAVVGVVVLRAGDDDRVVSTDTAPSMPSTAPERVPDTTIAANVTPTTSTQANAELLPGVYGGEGDELDAWPAYVEFRDDGTGRLLMLTGSRAVPTEVPFGYEVDGGQVVLSREAFPGVRLDRVGGLRLVTRRGRCGPGRGQ